jgi:hypothetical protein
MTVVVVSRSPSLSVPHARLPRGQGMRTSKRPFVNTCGPIVISNVPEIVVDDTSVNVTVALPGDGALPSSCPSRTSRPRRGREVRREGRRVDAKHQTDECVSSEGPLYFVQIPRSSWPHQCELYLQTPHARGFGFTATLAGNPIKR